MSAIDPVCGTEVDTLRARAVAIVDGTTYYFCCAAHKEQFLRERGRTPTPAAIPVERPAAVEASSAKIAIAEKTPAAVSATSAPVAEEPAEVLIERPRRSGPARYVVLVLIAAAIAVAVALLSHRG